MENLWGTGGLVLKCKKKTEICEIPPKKSEKIRFFYWNSCKSHWD